MKDTIGAMFFPLDDFNHLTDKQKKLLKLLYDEVATIVTQEFKSNIMLINATRKAIIFKNKPLICKNVLNTLAYIKIKDDYEFNTLIMKELFDVFKKVRFEEREFRERIFNETLVLITKVESISEELKQIVFNLLKENILNLINRRVGIKDSCNVYVYSNNDWDDNNWRRNKEYEEYLYDNYRYDNYWNYNNWHDDWYSPNFNINQVQLTPDCSELNRILLSPRNIVNVLLGIREGYKAKYAKVYNIFLDIIKEIYSKDVLQARYYYLDSYYKHKQSEWELNPYNNCNIEKFILIDKNLYLYYHKLQLLSDRSGINLITKECFPNTNKDSLKYFFNHIVKKGIYQYHSFESSMNNQFYGSDFRAVYEDGEDHFCIHKTDNMNPADLQTLADLSELINLHKHIPIRYEDFIMFDIKSHHQTINEFIILLGYCMQFSINTLKQLAVLKAKCHLRCKIKNNFYIIYAPKGKAVIVRILNTIFDNNFKISLKDINKNDQLIKIQAVQTTSCALIAVDEKLPTRYKYSYLEGLIKGNQFVIQDKYLENVFVKNRLPIIYVTDNVSNIDTINRCMDKKAEIIAFGNIPLEFRGSDNVPVELNEYISSLSKKEKYINVIRYFNICLTLYGIKLYLNKCKGLNKSKVIDNNFVVRDFINTCCTVQDGCYIKFTEFYEVFSQFFKEKYDSKVMKRVELINMIESMNIKYHRPHHSRKSNPYCVSGLKFKENVLDLIHNCDELTPKISDYLEHVLSEIIRKGSVSFSASNITT